MKPNPSDTYDRNVVATLVDGEWHVFTWADGNLCQTLVAIKDGALPSRVKAELSRRVVQVLIR